MIGEVSDMEYLYSKLIQYSSSDYYGFHMPGHKRKVDWISDVYDIDITEIDGFDDGFVWYI